MSDEMEIFDLMSNISVALTDTGVTGILASSNLDRMRGVLGVVRPHRGANGWIGGTASDREEGMVAMEHNLRWLYEDLQRIKEVLESIAQNVDRIYSLGRDG